MTDQRRKALADRLQAEHIYHVDYVRGTIALLALLPVLYGVLTWTAGDDLWAGTDIYHTALRMPGAPQSWGTIFMVIGVTLMVCSVRRKYRLVMWVSIVAALVMGMFMITFGTQYVITSNEAALPPAIAWGIFSLLFFNLWRMASKMHTLESVYRAQNRDHEPYADT